MKALTVQQPWANAIAHHGKVENRSWATSHRGALAVHAGQQLAPGFAFADYERITGQDAPPVLVAGAIIAVADLVDVHEATEQCVHDEASLCSPWGWLAWPDGRDRQVFHWVFADVVSLAEPIRCRGRLQLWTPPIEVRARLELVLGVHEWLDEIQEASR